MYISNFKNGSGIYKIKNIVNNKMYIGSAVNLKNRRRQHFHELKHNIHGNSHLQNSFNKHGEENFIFEVIEYVKILEELIYREEYYIDFYKTNNREFGYNKRFVPSTNLGLKHTQETKEKLSKAKTGVPLRKRDEPISEETKKQISESLMGNIPWNKGVPMREETKKKLSENNKGKRMGEENPFFGKQHTEESLKKMSESHIGKSPSDETRERMSIAQSGENNANYGIPMKEEQKIILSKVTQGVKNNKNSTSKYVGVSFAASRNKWTSYIKYMGKLIRIGSFDLEADAAIAYNNKALEIYGEDAKLNIIEEEGGGMNDL